MTASPHTGPGRETRQRAAVPDGDGVGVEAARRGAEAAVYCVSRVRRGVLLCCDITSTIRSLYDPNSVAYEALRAENSRRFKELWASKSPEERAAWCSAISKGVSRRSARFNVSTRLEHISTSSLVV